MALLLGHASIDENGNAAGGASGDQTGREVCTRSWYSKGWNLLLRPKSGLLAERSARACEDACQNPCIGYDQGGRNSLYALAKAADFDLAAISSPCECDCSSLMHVCAIAGGANVTYEGNGHTTRTMASAFLGSGDYEKLTEERMLSQGANLRRGDILVKEGSHTAMVLRGSETESTPVCLLAVPVLRRGMALDAVKTMQLLLHLFDDSVQRTGEFSDATHAALKNFQQAMNLEVDGICGEKTWAALFGLGGVG